MSIRQITDMNVIADTSAIRGRIIIAKNLDQWLTPHCGKQNQRNQMGLGLMQFSKLTIGIGSRRIKIAQRYVPNPMRCLNIFKHTLYDEFRVSVRIDGLLSIILLQR